MAQSKLESMTTVVLRLSVEEAQWLRAYVQNPILPAGAYESDEDDVDRVMRARLWHALPGPDEI